MSDPVVSQWFRVSPLLSEGAFLMGPGLASGGGPLMKTLLKVMQSDRQAGRQACRAAPILLHQRPNFLKMFVCVPFSFIYLVRGRPPVLLI